MIGYFNNIHLLWFTILTEEQGKDTKTKLSNYHCCNTFNVEGFMIVTILLDIWRNVIERRSMSAKSVQKMYTNQNKKFSNSFKSLLCTHVLIYLKDPTISISLATKLTTGNSTLFGPCPTIVKTPPGLVA